MSHPDDNNTFHNNNNNKRLDPQRNLKLSQPRRNKPPRRATGTTVVYDASSFRSTTTGYRMVLGSGDMLTGVDLGLYDMCPGDERTLIIPPQLGHGKRSLPVYRIPPDYQQLEWTIKLISIDETIRGETNTISREDRGSRFAYD